MQAHEAIGHFFCIFSELDYELNETTKVIFQVTHLPGADALVAEATFANKVDLIRSAIEFARRPDKSEPSKEWKENAQKTLKDIFTANDDRVQLAHSRLEPQPNGSVMVTRYTTKKGELKFKNKCWSQDDFRNKSTKIENMIRDLKAIKTELSTLVFAIGAIFSGEGTLTADAIVVRGPTPMQGDSPADSA